MYYQQGNEITIIDRPDYGKIALVGCYDVRFSEMGHDCSAPWIICLIC